MDLMQYSQNIQKKCLLDAVQPVVVGVSGGPDSLCLLDLLRKSGFNIIVGHLNHGLREAAILEEKKVREQCDEWRLQYFSKSVEIKSAALENHHTVEEEGRIARYRFLFDLARDHKAQAVLVAHNLNDQVETILMHLIRGTGLAGLRGMDYRQLPTPWSNTIPLVRPLLGTSKQEIMDYCQENGLSPSFDESNQETTFFRNRLRLDLVPFLETFNRNISNRIFKMAEVIREEDNFLNKETDLAIDGCLELSGENFCVFSKKDFDNLHSALKRRVIYTLMRRLNPESPNITFDAIQSAVNYINHPTTRGKKSLVAGLEISGYLRLSILLSVEKARLEDLWPQLSVSEKINPGQGSRINLNGSWGLDFPDEDKLSKDDPWKASLDAEKCGDLCLDTYHPGERFTPMGMGDRSIKVSDFWTNQGLPVRARARWPLVKTNNEIAWIPGFTVGEKYKVNEKTRRILVLRIGKTA